MTRFKNTFTPKSTNITVVISTNKSGTPIIVPQKLSNGVVILKSKDHPDVVIVKDRFGNIFGFKNYYTLKILEVLVGYKSCKQYKTEWDRLKNKSKLNRFMYKIINKMFKILRSFKDRLNA